MAHPYDTHSRAADRDRYASEEEHQTFDRDADARASHDWQAHDDSHNRAPDDQLYRDHQAEPADPLAELARLIGQGEPVADRGASPFYRSPAAYRPDEDERPDYEPEPYHTAGHHPASPHDDRYSEPRTDSHSDDFDRYPHGNAAQSAEYSAAPTSAYDTAPDQDDTPAWSSQSQRWQDNAYDNFVRSRQAQGDTYEDQAPIPPTRWSGDAWPEPTAPAAAVHAASHGAPAYDPYAEPVYQEPAPQDHRYATDSYLDPREGAHAPAYGTQPAGLAPLAAAAAVATAPVMRAAASIARAPTSPVRAAPRAADAYSPGHEVAAHPYDPPSQLSPSHHASAYDDRTPRADTHAYSGQAGYAAAEPAQDTGFRGPPPFAVNGPAEPAMDYYDEPPQRRGGRSMVTVLAVLGLAVIGTAGAFAYRTFTGGSSPSQVPVIRASNEPSKVVPPPPENNPDTAKLTYDRFGDRSQNEKVVPREEKPVDLNAVVRNNEPRVVLPGAPQPSSGNGQPLPPNIIAEPRRVKSVPIRSDSQDPVRTIPAQTPSNIAGANTQRPAMASANAPLDVTTQPPAQATIRQAVTRPVNPPASGAPLSITPDATGTTAPSVAQPPARAAVAARASPPTSGGFVVQVASQRSEADAQSAFRSIQNRYSSVLGGQSSFVKRADLGERGTYYRAVVGPFGNRADAVQLCSSLKSAGGDCIVQSN